MVFWFLLMRVCGLLGSRLEALVVPAAVVTEHGNYTHKLGGRGKSKDHGCDAPSRRATPVLLSEHHARLERPRIDRDQFS